MKASLKRVTDFSLCFVLITIVFLSPAPAAKGQDFSYGSLDRNLTFSETLTYAESPSLQQDFASQPLGSVAIYFNALGMLQFGPVFGIEFKTIPNLYADFHLRWVALGLLYRVVALEPDDDVPALTNMSIGTGVRYYLKRPGAKNCLFFGGYFEYSWEKIMEDEGNWETHANSIAFIGHAGYRMRFPSGFFMNFGGYFGIAPEVRDEGWAVATPDIVIEYELNMHPFIMADFTLGYEF